MRSLGGLVFFVLLVFTTFAPSASADLVPRQGRQGTTTTSTSTSTSTSTTTSTSSTTSSSTDTTTSTTTSTSTSTTSTSTSTTSTTSTTTSAVPPPTSQPPGGSSQVTVSTSTETTVTVTNSGSSTSSSPSASSTSSNKNNDEEDSGIGTGSIIGLSVAGGVAVIGIIGFFVWKFTRKRFTDLDGDEAIKWPDLQNDHAGGTHALPVNNTGRAGFDTGSDGELSRVASTNNYSTTDFNSGVHDPYAVPPLPHLNPNQPYRDDPSHGGAYYDPYHGPVPGTLDAPGPGQWGGEAIPMTQMGTGGRMSPGPHAAYGGGPDAGRQSPGPHNAYGPGPEPYDVGRQSPGPYGAYGGRASPGPGVAYGNGAYGGR